MGVFARFFGQNAALGLFAGLLLAAPLWAQETKKEPKKPAAQLPVGNLDAKDWLKVSTKPLEKGEIDRLVNAELAKVSIKPAPPTTDEQFIRRVHLDLTGKLPAPADIVAFLKDTSKDKRAKLIDKLLESDAYARHWGNYWRNVITTRATIDFRLTQVVPQYERWMTAQYKANKSWADITRAQLTASGKILYKEPDKNAQAFFLMSRRGADSITEIAAETSRIFLGVQIQCAQCHDHPSDVWKRRHFHEFAAYFARYRGERPILEEKKFVGVQLISLPFGEHRMPDKEDPKRGLAMNPKFLDGKQPAGAKPVPSTSGPIGRGGFFPKKGGFGKGGFGRAGGMSDDARRKALADQITDKNNPWFAAAFVNRMWGEVMGQSFYSPIDDLGPQKDAMMPTVIARVSASFRGNDYNIKQLFRDILNSDAYQRQIRPGEPGDEHLLFAARNPVRMNSTALVASLTSTLGPLSSGFGGKFGKFGGGGFGRFGGGVEAQIRNEFLFDPSTKAEEIEGSISQALILMNNPQINQKIRAQGTNMLGRILANYDDNTEALRVVYLRTLARRPTDREAKRCLEHIKSAGSRAEAFEDILWALINSTEFQMKR
ncbi:MAG: DUF1549 domain-containing protein [Planctomycetes bacterium]|nr:DUF1549 domain-containing protein [Planctomycetota bacterium]